MGESIGAMVKQNWTVATNYVVHIFAALLPQQLNIICTVLTKVY